MSDNNKKTSDKLADVFLALIYIIIIAIGIVLCIDKAEGAKLSHLVAITLSLLAITFLRAYKARAFTKEVLSAAALSLLGIFAIVAIVLF